jgi:hypothetical protein
MIVVFLMFRVLFNRYYELNERCFLPTSESNEFTRRVVPLGGRPVTAFNLPWRYLPELQDSTIGARQSAVSLSLALFEANPMDQLYRIHVALLGVNRGASAYLYGDNAVTGQPMLLGFDDHFALFFGLWMAADIPDARYLKRVIEECAPRAALSSTFEYAFTNLEAVVMHVEQLSAD